MASLDSSTTPTNRVRVLDSSDIAITAEEAETPFLFNRIDDEEHLWVGDVKPISVTGEKPEPLRQHLWVGDVKPISVTEEKPEPLRLFDFSAAAVKPGAPTPQLPVQAIPHHNGKTKSNSMAGKPKESPASSSTNIEIDDIVEHMRKIVDQELDIEPNHTPATIFRVPNSVIAVKPESYTPHMIGLGPLHHLRPEVLDMQKEKVAAIKRFIKAHSDFNRRLFIKTLLNDKDELRIRACYDKLLDFKRDSLVWMTAIDALFLSEVLSIHFKTNQEQESAGEYLVAGKELVHNAILRDIMMLENQIPLFLLDRIADQVRNFSLPKKLLVFCKAMSPFDVKVKDEVKEQEDKVKEKEEEYVKLVHKTCPHLLCLLYILIVPIKPPEPPPPPPPTEGSVLMAMPLGGNEFVSVVSQLAETAIKLNVPGLDSLKEPLTVLLGLRKLPYSMLKKPFASRDISGRKNPIIPPASSLAKAGVKFQVNSKDFKEFHFNDDEEKLYLPVIKLGVNSEVILRNLVAFEALLGSSLRSQPKLETELNHSACKAMETAKEHVLASYTKLMDGILETAEDVKILRDAEIIKGHLESDEEVVKLFSGMSISGGLTSDDEIVIKLNNFYNNSQKIKIHKFMSKWGSILYRSLQFVVVVVLLALMALRAFCSVYSCSHILKYSL